MNSITSYNNQYENNNYSKDYYYHEDQKSIQGYNNQQQQFSSPETGYNTCLSPSLLSPLNYLNSFDQISYIDDSPRNDYVFNGEFTMNFNSDFDGSFPLASNAGAAVEVKTSHLMDNQASQVTQEIVLDGFTADMTASGTQLTPLTIESQPNGRAGIKNSFNDAKSNNVLVNLSDDDVLSNASSYSRSPSSATVDWKFTE